MSAMMTFGAGCEYWSAAAVEHAKDHGMNAGIIFYGLKVTGICLVLTVPPTSFRVGTALNGLIVVECHTHQRNERMTGNHDSPDGTDVSSRTIFF